VYGDEDRRPGEWGHWTGRGMTWNSMCAACHNTRLRKNYDFASDTYQTAMAEPSVGCESCHGPMVEHNSWQARHPGEKGDSTLKPFSRDQMLDTCAACHSRRAELTGDFKPGEKFTDHYNLTIPNDTELFYPDGQIRDEDYEFTSFLSSRMYSAGVRCVDCHEPHSGKTRAAENALCMTCHAAPVLPAPKIDPLTHSHHANGQRGDNCVDCHMPQTTYMQRHARHDHGFTVPDPRLTKDFAVPNACGRCHTDKPAAWAIEKSDQWYGKKMDRPAGRRARIIAAARKRDAGSPKELAKLLRSETNALWRASAAELLKNWSSDRDVTSILLGSLADPDATVRAASVRALESQAQGGNAAVEKALQNSLIDPARCVRADAAWALRAILDLNSVAGQDLANQLKHNCDQPAGALQLGVFHLDRGELANGLKWIERAVAWDTNSAPLHHEFAIALSKAGKTEEAVRELKMACALAPTEPEYRFKLGLAFNELGNLPAAIQAFQEAVKLDPQFSRAWYNLGLARNSAGETEEGLSCLVRAESLDGESALIPFARATILAQLGRSTEARRAVRRALELQPEFAQAQELLRSLGQ
jgi:predicted CXXCH cytochrome family protein